jgi:hypothetical protein
MWLKLLYIGFILLMTDTEALMSANKFSLNSPQKLSNCKAKLDDGSIVDLTSQDNASKPRLKKISK